MSDHKSPQQFALIAEMYRLLSTYDFETFESVSRNKEFSRDLRSAARAFAFERSKLIDATEKKRSQRAPPATDNKPSANFSSLLNPDLDQRTFHKNLLAILLDTKQFPTKAALKRFSNALGITIAAEARESKAKFAQKLARSAAKNMSLRAKIYDAVRSSSSGQTSGWLDVIMGKP